MANRLAIKLPVLVSSCQSAFVKGEASTITSSSCNKPQEHCIFRTDRESYSSWILVRPLTRSLGLSLFEVLSHLGFGPFWCGILSKLLWSSSTRILVNGEPGELICHQRGLCQGDLLSPMLFILVMDVLNSFISKASERELLQPILRRGTGQHVSIYADDVVMFLQPHRDEMAMVRVSLKIFGAASGLVTNIRKSSITPI
jgi:hypothetical protein